MKIVSARWFERGWERTIDVRSENWKKLDIKTREKITNRWSLAAAHEIIASGENIPPISYED